MLKQKGITLIELMIVVAIIGLLSVIAYPAYDNYVKRSKRVTAEGDLYAFRNAMQRYFSENNSYVGSNGAAIGTDADPIAALFPSQSPIDGGAAAYDLSVTGGNLSLSSTNVRGVTSSTVENCWK